MQEKLPTLRIPRDPIAFWEWYCKPEYLTEEVVVHPNWIPREWIFRQKWTKWQLSKFQFKHCAEVTTTTWTNAISLGFSCFGSVEISLPRFLEKEVTNILWLVVSTHLKNISQSGNLTRNGDAHKKYLKPPPGIWLNSSFFQRVYEKIVKLSLNVLEINRFVDIPANKDGNGKWTFRRRISCSKWWVYVLHLCLPECKWVICDALCWFSDPIPIRAVHMKNKHIFERPSVSSVTTNLWMYSGSYTRISRR